MTTLGQHVRTQKGYAFKSGWYCDDGRPIVKVSDFTDNSIDSSSLVRIPERVAGDYLKYELKLGDVVIQTVGSWPSNPKSVVGKAVRVPGDVAGALLNQNAVKVEPTEELDKGFLYYLLRSERFKAYIVGTAQGAASQAAITLDSIRAFSFELPRLDTQRRVAETLSAYDDLIENYARRIKILEEMAQSLYREWFVHFRFPGHERVPLLENRIPQGWEAKKIGDVIELAYGRALKAEARAGGPVPVFGSSGIIGFHDKPLAKGPGIIVGRKGNVGSVFWTDGDFYPIDTAFFVRTELSLPYVFYNLRHQKFINNDAAVPGLSRRAAYLKSFVIPDMETLKAFEAVVTPIFSQLRVMREKDSNLRLTRDLLLPKLISGEVAL